MELLLMFAIFNILLFIAGVLFVVILGALLLTDYVFKTHVGRRVCRWIFYEN